MVSDYIKAHIAHLTACRDRTTSATSVKQRDLLEYKAWQEFLQLTLDDVPELQKWSPGEARRLERILSALAAEHKQNQSAELPWL